MNNKIIKNKKNNKIIKKKKIMKNNKIMKNKMKMKNKNNLKRKILITLYLIFLIIIQLLTKLIMIFSPQEELLAMKKILNLLTNLKKYFMIKNLKKIILILKIII